MLKVDVTKKYVLAVSGGADSMAMLDMFCRLTPRPDFSVVTVNHGIRKNAAGDCLLVQTFCDKHNVGCTVYNVDAPAFCKQNKLSAESGARVLRYGIFDKQNCDFVCLAHNADDNAETVLMHIVRGCGLKGACGIATETGRYLRPLLGYYKEELRQYCLDNGVPFTDDDTNADTKYMRNFVRAEILPRFTSLNANATANINKFAAHAAADEEFLQSLADVSQVKFSSCKAEIPLNLLVQVKPVAQRVLAKVFAKLGVYCDIEQSHFDAVITLAGSTGGKSVNLPFDLIAVNDYNVVTVLKNENLQAPSFCAAFTVGKTTTPFGTVVVGKQSAKNSLKFDLSKIPNGTQIRTPQKGDIFTKFGGGSKPLNRYLIDKKIPRRNRDKLLLVANGGTVLVVCGVEISDAVKTDANTKETAFIYIAN